MSAKLPSINSCLTLVRFTAGLFGRLLTKSLTLFIPFLVLSNSFGIGVQAKSKTRPATKEDVFLYRGLGASYICNARAAGVEFPKATWIAAATYVQVLNGRHGGFVSSAGKKKLTEKQLFAGAEFQIITGALQYCPKEIPGDVKDKINEALKKQKKSKRR